MNSILRRRRALMGQKSGWTIYGYESVGTPSISNNILTPSADSWVRSPVLFAPGDKAWEIRTKVKKFGKTGWQNVINGGGVTIQCEQNSWNAWLYLKSAGSSTNDITSGTKNKTLTQDTWLYLRLGFNGTKYYMGTSSNGVTFADVNVESTAHIAGNGKILFGYKGSNTSVTQIYYDLTATEIWIDNALWWKAVR